MYLFAPYKAFQQYLAGIVKFKPKAYGYTLRHKNMSKNTAVMPRIKTLNRHLF
jgi:hypothetical protein